MKVDKIEDFPSASDVLIFTNKQDSIILKKELDKIFDLIYESASAKTYSIGINKISENAIVFLKSKGFDVSPGKYPATSNSTFIRWKVNENNQDDCI